MSATRRSSVPTTVPGTPSLPLGFTDEVMQAIGRAPRPSPTRSFRSAVGDRSIAEAGAALSVAWRIIRRNTSMPLMVRAQALALVVLVAGSIVGGGALAGVVAYQTVAPIVHAISEPVGDRAPTSHDEVRALAAPEPSEVQPDAPTAVAPADPSGGGPDRPPTRTAIDDTPVVGDGDERPSDGSDDRDEAHAADDDAGQGTSEAADPDLADTDASAPADEVSDPSDEPSEAAGEPPADVDADTAEPSSGGEEPVDTEPGGGIDGG